MKETTETESFGQCFIHVIILKSHNCSYLKIFYQFIIVELSIQYLGILAEPI